MPVGKSLGSKPARFWSVTDGCFNEKGDSPLTEKGDVNTIEGTFKSIRTIDDPGNAKAKIAPGIKINVTIEDEDNIHVVSFRANTYVASSAVSRFPFIKPGDYIRLRATSGKENTNVCFINVSIQGEDGLWSPVKDKEEIVGDEVERTDKVLSIVTAHPAYKEGRPS